MAALVLAAGGGRRFGGTKQLAELDGRPLVAHAVATAVAARLAPVVVVVGHDAEAVAEAARQGGEVEVVVNRRYAEGQSASLRTGVAAVVSRPDVRALVVLLADQPGVLPETVRKVVGAVRGGAVAARARYEDRPGHPVAFDRRVFGRLAEVEGDAGARQLLAALHTVEVRVPGPLPEDVDTPDDLARWRERW